MVHITFLGLIERHWGLEPFSFRSFLAAIVNRVRQGDYHLQIVDVARDMTCSWRWFIHPETAISRKQNESKTLWSFKAHYREDEALVESLGIHADRVSGPYGK